MQTFLDEVKKRNLLKNDFFDIVFVDCGNATKAQVQSFANARNCAGVQYAYEVTEKDINYYAMCYYLSVSDYQESNIYVPVVVVIDENNRVRYAEAGTTTNVKAFDVMSKLVEEDVPAPVITKATVNYKGEVNLEWERVEGATAYYIYRNVRKGAVMKKVGTVTSGNTFKETLPKENQS